ncbi:MAG TPA: MBL fold metallo-hydrolase [Candidatus Intestinimonas stercoravium]|nr:MBL fold metallo-hydrolase [Candidatus Intestinimonas stercoravium]
MDQEGYTLEEIMEHIYRIPVPLPGNPLKELNAYLIKGKDRALLIDTGFRQEPCRQALFAGLKELGLAPGEVDILVTHRHSDHAGLAPEAAGEKGTIYVSSVDMPFLDDMTAREESRKGTEQVFISEGFPKEAVDSMWSNNPAWSQAPIESDRYVGLEDGEIVEAGGYRLQALLMPGHTPGQMCFWMEEQQAMFLGDHVLFDITPNITTWEGMSDALGTYMEKLREIRAYDVKRPLPGHRKPGDMRARIDQLLAHHAARLEEAYQAVAGHPGAPAYEIAGHMTWKIRASSWADFPLTQKWFAVGECMSHLEHLIAEGRVRREIVDGQRAYFAL